MLGEMIGEMLGSSSPIERIFRERSCQVSLKSGLPKSDGHLPVANVTGYSYQ